MYSYPDEQNFVAKLSSCYQTNYLKFWDDSIVFLREITFYLLLFKKFLPSKMNTQTYSIHNSVYLKQLSVPT